MLFFNIFERSLVGKKPPEEIIVNAKFNESKALIDNKFRIIRKRLLFISIFTFVSPFLFIFYFL